MSSPASVGDSLDDGVELTSTRKRKKISKNTPIYLNYIVSTLQNS